MASSGFQVTKTCYRANCTGNGAGGARGPTGEAPHSLIAVQHKRCCLMAGVRIPWLVCALKGSWRGPKAGGGPFLLLRAETLKDFQPSYWSREPHPPPTPNNDPFVFPMPKPLAKTKLISWHMYMAIAQTCDLALQLSTAPGFSKAGWCKTGAQSLPPPFFLPSEGPFRWCALRPPCLPGL